MCVVTPGMNYIVKCLYCNLNTISITDGKIIEACHLIHNEIDKFISRGLKVVNLQEGNDCYTCQTCTDMGFQCSHWISMLVKYHHLSIIYLVKSNHVCALNIEDY